MRSVRPRSPVRPHRRAAVGLACPLGHLLAALLLLASASACSLLPPDERALAEQVRETEAQRVGADELRALLQSIELFGAAGNIEGLVALHAREAMWVAPGEAPCVGRQAIEGLLAQLFESYEVALVIEVESLHVAGRSAQVWAWSATTCTPRAGGEPRVQRDHVRLVLERDSEDRWRIQYAEWRVWEDAPREGA